MDKERFTRAKQMMAEDGIDVLICRLPENVLYLTGYWPVIGASMVVFPVNGDPTLLLPFSEIDYAKVGWVDDMRTFPFINMNATANPTAQILMLLHEIWHEKGYRDAIIGYEGSFELVAGNYVAAEARVVAPATIETFKSALSAEAKWVDATRSILRSRIVKSRMEVENLRITSEIACMGLEHAREMFRPGVKESAIAGFIEGIIHGMGIGFKNVTRSRGYCFVMSGINSANSWRPFCVASPKMLAYGEPVLVELDAVANGYFIDITRTFFVGKPTTKEKEIFDVVQEALCTALSAVKPGLRVAELDGIARKVIDNAGYGEYFNHQLGHGIGLQFHEPPAIHPASDEVLERGTVLAIEPAIYIPGWGGVRLEENVMVTDNGFEMLTPFPQRVE
jgi:Xaa-Pro aminopeptidase